MKVTRLGAIILAVAWVVFAAGCGSLSGGGQASSEHALTKVKFQEVVHALDFIPHYVAMGKGFYEQEGLDVETVTSEGSDVGTAALLSGHADIILTGPQAVVYVENSESPEKVKAFATLRQTCVIVLVARDSQDNFSIDDVRGKTILGWQPGSTPELVLEYVLKNNNIAPGEDVDIITNVSPPALPGAFLSGQGDFAVLNEPNVSQIEQEQGYQVALLGQDIGRVDYTTFVATDKFIEERPEIVQAWTNGYLRGRLWVEEAETTEIAEVVSQFFPGISHEILESVVARLKEADHWPMDPTPNPEGFNKLQDIMVEGGVLDQDKIVSYESITVTQFAEKALREITR